MIGIRDITVEKEFEGLIPTLSDEEHLRLLTAIVRDGFRDPLVVWLNHGILLDGHNRYRIWETSFQDDESRQPSIVEMKFDDRDSAIEWVIKNQLSRRNLVPAMRVALELKLKPIVMARAKANQQAAGGALSKKSSEAVEPVKTMAVIAKAAGVSEPTARQVEKVIAAGNESVTKAMLAGEKKVNTALNEVAPKPVTPWKVIDDINRFRKLFDVLSDNWKTESDQNAMRMFFRLLGSEV